MLGRRFEEGNECIDAEVDGNWDKWDKKSSIHLNWFFLSNNIRFEAIIEVNRIVFSNHASIPTMICFRNFSRKFYCSVNNENDEQKCYEDFDSYLVPFIQNEFIILL